MEEFDLDLVFKNEPEKYTYKIKPVKDYVSQSSIFISKMLGIERDEAEKYIKEVLKESKDIKNPEVIFRERDENGDVKKKKDTLLGYLNYVDKNNYILSPSFTVYFPPSKKESIYAGFLDDNIAERNKYKKEYKKAKVAGEKEKAEFFGNLQLSKKVFNNALSGAFGSNGTVVFNPSAHYTLTSVTRGMASIGNAISESMIVGNRFYNSPDAVLNHFTALLDNIDYNKTKEVIEKYNLNVPTPMEILEKIVIKNIKRYWRSHKIEKEILEFLSKLDKVERAIIAFTNDFFTIANYNREFIKSKIDYILNSDKLDIKFDDPLGYINSLPGWVQNLLSHLGMEYLKGLKNGINDLQDEDKIIKIAKYGYAFIEVLKELKDLIKNFFVTDVFPIDMAYIKSMIRESIVLSDTDSTCASYQEWAMWYKGNYIIDKETVSVTAIVMTFVTQIIDHYIKTFGGNMNIGFKKAQILSMKNEYFWDVFVNDTVKKHYFAKVMINEGNVFKDFMLELKGQSYMATNSYYKVRELRDEIAKYILTTVSENKKISAKHILYKIADLEKEIIDILLSGRGDIYKTEKIKKLEMYKDKNNPGKTPYFHHILWQEVFAEKYGDAPEPEYISYKVPLKINNKTDMKQFLETLDDEFRNNMLKVMERYDKTELKNIRVPIVIAYEKGIPEELRPYIDLKSVLDDNLLPLYKMISTIGLWLNPETYVVDLLPEYNKYSSLLHED